MIQFSVPGEPVAQKRHRDGKGKRKYDPCKAKKEAFLIQALVESGIDAPLDGPLFMFIHCRLRRPKNDPHRLYAMGGSHGDVDNYAKFVMDALQGRFYDNDSQIVSLTVIKEFDDERPRTDVIISKFKPMSLSLSKATLEEPE